MLFCGGNFHNNLHPKPDGSSARRGILLEGEESGGKNNCACSRGVAGVVLVAVTPRVCQPGVNLRLLILPYATVIDRWMDRFRFITAPFKRLKHRAPVCFCVGATSRLLIELMGYISWSGSADCAPQQDIYKIVSAAFRRPARPFCQSLGRWCYILL